MSLSRRLEVLPSKKIVERQSSTIDMADAESVLMWDRLKSKVDEVRKTHLCNEEMCFPYGKMVGEKTTREVFAKTMQVFHFDSSVQVSVEDIVVLNGLQFLPFLFCLQFLPFLFCNEDDSVVIPSPFYSGFKMCLSRFGCNIKKCPRCYDEKTATFSLDLDILNQSCSEKGVKALLICHPNNPIGTYFNKEEIKGIFDICIENDIHLISDEVFLNCVLDPKEYSSVYKVLMEEQDPNRRSDLQQRVHIIYSLSKDFGLSGFRMGFMFSKNKKVISALTQNGMLQSASKDTMYLTTEIFKDDEFVGNFIKENRSKLIERFDVVMKYLEDKEGLKYAAPKAGLFIWIRFVFISTWEQEDEFCDYIEREKKILIVRGSIYESLEPGWFRIVITSHDLTTTLFGLSKIFEGAREFKKKDIKKECGKKQRWVKKHKTQEKRKGKKTNVSISITLKELELNDAIEVLKWYKKRKQIPQ